MPSGLNCKLEMNEKEYHYELLLEKIIHLTPRLGFNHFFLKNVYDRFVIPNHVAVILQIKYQPTQVNPNYLLSVIQITECEQN